MRIQKFVAESGVCSRRAAEKLVEEGRVYVNGKPAEIGQDVDPENDRVMVDRKRVYIKKCEKQYFIFYKPRGVITSMAAQDDRSVVAEFIKNIKGRVYPVGRLDRDSEGLLLLTDDGELAGKLMHPSSNTPKTYRVTVRGEVPDAPLNAMRAGMELDDGPTKPAEVAIQKAENNKTVLHITITEGRNRQIRRMCEKLGLEVLLLKRIAEGDLKIGHLQPGQYRPLTEREKEALLASVGMTYVRKEAPKSARAFVRKKSDLSVNERRFRKQMKQKQF